MKRDDEWRAHAHVLVAHDAPTGDDADNGVLRAPRARVEVAQLGVQQLVDRIGIDLRTASSFCELQRFEDDHGNDVPERKMAKHSLMRSKHECAKQRNSTLKVAAPGRRQ